MTKGTRKSNQVYLSDMGPLCCHTYHKGKGMNAFICWRRKVPTGPWKPKSKNGDLGKITLTTLNQKLQPDFSDKSKVFFLIKKIVRKKIVRKKEVKVLVEWVGYPMRRDRTWQDEPSTVEDDHATADEYQQRLLREYDEAPTPDSLRQLLLFLPKTSTALGVPETLVFPGGR